MNNPEFEKIQKEYEEESQKQGISLAIDIVIFTIKNDSLQILLNQRQNEPYKNSYGLPGGFALKNISLKENAQNLLFRDTNISNIYLEQLFTFGEIERDPRGRTISVTYYALLDYNKLNLIPSEKYKHSKWFTIKEIESLNLAFDHKKIINTAYNRIQNKIEYTNIAFQLLGEKFTLAQLQRVYEIILNQEIDKRNFRKKIAETDLLIELDEVKQMGRMRPAKLYKFKENTKETMITTKKRWN